VECSLLSAALVTFGLSRLIRFLRRSREDFEVGRQLAVGGALRFLVIALFSSTPALAALRGPDDQTFAAAARAVAKTPFLGHEWVASAFGELHVTFIALQLKLLDTTDVFSMRIVQAGLALAGVCLLAAAVYDLAGPGAARWVAWVAAVEPAAVFFAGFLHKDPQILLAEGVVALGAARVWKRPDLQGLLLMGGGTALATLTRGYAGGFLGLAALIVVTHAALRREPGGRPRSPRLAAIAVGALLMVVVAAGASSNRLLDSLQRSQDATAAESSNLKLEPVDFSSPLKVAVNSPRRVTDLLLRPYPWQLANNSQRLGALGTLVAWSMLALLILAVVRYRWDALRRAPPLAYLAATVLFGYALSVANAGTGFRYRVHVLFFLTGLLGVLYGREEFMRVRKRSRQIRLPWRAATGAPEAR
jgi:hypothetical protein